MTAHYTHVSEATARDVALTLPAFMDAKKLPPPPPKKMIEAAPVEALGLKLSAKTWKTVKKEILVLARSKTP